MKKIIGASLIILVLAALMMSCANTSSDKPVPAEKKRYSIIELVPGEVFIVNHEHKGWGNFFNPAPYLSEGVCKVSQNYIIKSATPITESLSARGTSATSALLLLVEPRK